VTDVRIIHREPSASNRNGTPDMNDVLIPFISGVQLNAPGSIMFRTRGFTRARRAEPDLPRGKCNAVARIMPIQNDEVMTINNRR
jgi:hypothetical protein